MGNQEKIDRLLTEYQRLVSRLNDINDQMNEVGTDTEDMIPGHDEGGEFYAKFVKYQSVMAQITSIRGELRKLGYKRAL